MHVGHEHVQLAVVVRQQNRVRNAAQQFADIFARLNWHKERSVVERVEPSHAVRVGARLERNLESRQLNSLNQLILLWEDVREEFFHFF